MDERGIGFNQQAALEAAPAEYENGIKDGEQAGSLLAAAVRGRASAERDQRISGIDSLGVYFGRSGQGRRISGDFQGDGNICRRHVPSGKCRELAEAAGRGEAGAAVYPVSCTDGGEDAGHGLCPNQQSGMRDIEEKDSGGFKLERRPFFRSDPWTISCEAF